MAEISVNAQRKGNWLIFEWDGVTEADTFEPIYLNHNVSDVFIEVTGTIGGATVVLKGYVSSSSASVNVVDPSGTAISLTAVGASAVRDAFPWLQPSHSGGINENINIKMYMKVV